MRNKTFTHVVSELDPSEIVRGTLEDGRRFYEYKGQNPRYAGKSALSITTMLGSFPKPEIVAWRQALGEEEAQRQMGIAARQGEAVHRCAEAYLMNEPNFPLGTMPNVIDLFKRIQSALDRIDNIVCQEMPLFGRYSVTEKAGLRVPLTHWYITGTVDCIGDFDGLLSVIDFKTSTGTKSLDMIEDYMIQCTAYALMYYCMTGIAPKQIVVIIASEECKEAQVFTASPSEYFSKLGDMLEKFYS